MIPVKSSHLELMASDTRPPVAKGKVREKVYLKPGFHLTDWMRLQQTLSIPNDTVRKISKAELATHSSEFDCWTAYNGKVYNMTQYIAYHPGGKQKLMLGAGKDCTDLFNKFHRWVNIDSILARCVIGVLSKEEDTILEEEEGEDDDLKVGK